MPSINQADIAEAAVTAVLAGGICYFLVTDGNLNQTLTIAGISMVSCWAAKMIIPNFYISK